MFEVEKVMPYLVIVQIIGVVSLSLNSLDSEGFISLKKENWSSSVKLAAVFAIGDLHLSADFNPYY
jgi:uncharacterized membrane protein (Fun14 family)